MCVGSPGFIPADGVVNVQVICKHFGQRVENVYNVISGDSLTMASLERIRDKFLIWLASSYRDYISEECSGELLVLKDMTTEVSVELEESIKGVFVGGLAGSPLPGHNTFTVKWLTGLSGRSRRGRTYHLAMTSTLVVGNQINPTFHSSILAGYEGLITTLADGGVNDVLCVVSRCGEGVWRSTALITPIIGCTIDSNIDSQRRRLTGRGT